MLSLIDCEKVSKKKINRTTASKWYDEYGWERERAVIYVSMPFNNISENVLIGLLAKFLAIYYYYFYSIIILLSSITTTFSHRYMKVYECKFSNRKIKVMCD